MTTKNKTKILEDVRYTELHRWFASEAYQRRVDHHIDCCNDWENIVKWYNDGLGRQWMPF